MLAMRFGDNCWINGLESRPELNGRRVTLYEWLDPQQRWRCEPVGWNWCDGYVAVRPKNLRREPPAAAAAAAVPVDGPSARLAAKHNDEKVRRRLAENVAAMAVADGEVSSDEDEAERMFQEMQAREEAKLQTNAFDALLAHWPSHADGAQFVATFSERDAKSYTAPVHDSLRKMFESRHDLSVVKETARGLCATGGSEHMRTAFYNYQKVLLKAGSDAAWPQKKSQALWHLLKGDVSHGWDGIGGWVH